MPFLRKYTGPLKTAARKRLSAIAIAVDAYFNYVTLLLQGDGTNGAQNNTFLDSSTNNFTITRNGNTTQGSFSPYGSNWSNFFDGTGDYLSISDNAALDLSTGDFTIECWVFPTTGISDVDGLIGKRSQSQFQNGDWRIAYRSANTAFGIAAGTNNTDRLTPAITLNAWNHIAFVRSSGTLSCYANGTRGANLTWTDNLDNSETLHIGLNSAGYDFPGYISNVRIVKGTAVYSGATYTVPTTPLTAITNTSLLTCQSNRFVDNSANQLPITQNGTPSVQRFNPFGTSTAYSTSVIGGSAYFDGDGDYLQTPSNAAFSFGTGDFTMECWIYPTATAGLKPIFDTKFASDNNGFTLFMGNGNYQFSLGYPGFSSQGLSATARGNAWNYVVLQRTSGQFQFFLNGVRTSNTTLTINNTDTVLRVGAMYDYYGGQFYYYPGYISNCRVVKGTSVYGGSATTISVPTAPLTSVSGTSLILDYTNGAIFDNAMINDLQTVGNAQISTSVVKYGTGSLAFDGTGDYLLGPSTPNVSFGDGDFTIEAWVYRAASPGNNQSIFQKGRTADSNLEFSMILSGSNFLSCFYTTDGSTVAQPFSSTTAVPLNTWTHIAITRSGSTWRCFVNGTLEATTTAAVTLYTGTGLISSGANPAGDNPLTGYIDDLRITKGYARYTANFTPPNQALPTFQTY